jgi:hypothetical protein
VKPQPGTKPKEGEEQKKQGCGTKALPFTVVHHEPGPLGQGKRVKASPLTKCPPVEGPGSLPSQSIYKAQFDCLAQKGAGDYWVRMHLLHGMTERAPVRNLHGPGNKMWNLIIGDKWVNGQMSLDLERKVIPQVYDQNAVLWYETTIDDYIAGNEYFVRTFHVRYGKYDTATGTEGPELDNWTYAASKWPPRCPPSLSAGFPAAFPLVLPASHKQAFQSTIEICYQRLTTRVFNVPDGGVRLQLSADWASRFQDSTVCPTDDYEVTLHRSNLLLDDEIATAKVPVGGQSIDWEPLPPGDYYFTIDAPPHSPLCCLRGDILVSTFYSPMPSYEPLDPSMIA